MLSRLYDRDVLANHNMGGKIKCLPSIGGGEGEVTEYQQEYQREVYPNKLSANESFIAEEGKTVMDALS